MKQFYLLIAFVIILASTLHSQIRINTDGTSHDPSAMFDVRCEINNQGCPATTGDMEFYG